MIYQRPDSPYWWIKLPRIEGELKPLYRSTGTRNKREAQKLHDKLTSERWRVHNLGVKPERTWDDATQKWLEETSHKRTHEWDKAIIRWLQPHLGGVPLLSINRELLDAVRSRRAKGVKPSTVNRYMALVRSILRRACDDWEWIERVPKVGMLKQPAGRVRSLTRPEFERLLAELPLHLAEMAIFSVATGLRQANVTRLQWRQVSLERRHLWVAADQHKNGQAHSVPLNEAAMAVLERRKGDHRQYVFTYEGQPIQQVSTKAWRSALKRAGITDFRWHDLRHTFATWHREEGTPTWELQRLGGWKSASMVERYAHVGAEGLQLAASRLDNRFGVTR
jgi:integrase